MTQEEKAKAYDEAIERAKQLPRISAAFDRFTIERIFPELKESEEEQSKKWILEYLYDGLRKSDEQFKDDFKTAIAWLEKQGEQKSIWHDEDEEPKRGSLILLIMQSGTPIVAKIIEPNHTLNHGERWAYIDDLLEKQGQTFTKKDVDDAYLKGVCDAKQELEKQSSQILANSTKTCKDEQKFNIGDEIKTANEEPLTITKIDEKGYWSEDLFICGFDDAAKWKLVEQNPAWSEEDKDFMYDTLSNLTELKDRYGEGYGNVGKCIEWLKAIKDRYTWKPTKEQLTELRCVISGCSYDIEPLVELEKELKAL